MTYISKKRNELNDNYYNKLNFTHLPPKEKEQALIQNNNDNIIFLNSVVSLLSDKNNPFHSDKVAENNYINFITSNRPELKSKINTLLFIKNNINTLLTKENLQKLYNIQDLVNYLMQHSELIEKMPAKLDCEIDLNYAVEQSLKSNDFSLKNPENPVRICWDNLSRKTLVKERTL